MNISFDVQLVNNNNGLLLFKRKEKKNKKKSKIWKQENATGQASRRDAFQVECVSLLRVSGSCVCQICMVQNATRSLLGRDASVDFQCL